ncbi:MAG: hypothetical protein HY461_01330 [Parcubacteria group bacterium]|nr:hypothetical protein [Parcubacteria group bacterium]
MANPTTLPAHTSPKDFFLHLLAMVALYASAISLTMVLYQLINLWIPDPLEQYFYSEGAYNTIRNALSFLIVTFPVYVLTTWQLHKSYAADQSKRNLWVRKWLLYLTLFVAALIIMFTTVALVRSLLEGQLTLRFFLQLLAIIFVAAAIFGYYLWDLKKYKIE